MSKFLSGSAASLSAILLATTAHAQDTSVPFEDEIIVTGSPLARTLDDAITGVSVLSGEELQRNLSGTIGETLKREPGVSSTFFGPGASRPIIRGQGGDRVRVLNNGIGSIDASSASPDHAVAAEPAQAERIEVLRGAGILRYGSSGAGGVVNVIDGRIPTELPENTEVNFRLGATSVDGGHEAAVSLDQRLGNFALHIDGTEKGSGNYDDGDGDEIENSFVDARSGTIGGSFIGERGHFGVALSKFETTYGVPGGHGHEEEEEEHEEGEEHDEEEEEEEENVFIDLDQTRLDINAAVEMDGIFERLQFFGGYADYEHTEFEGPGEVGTIFTNEGVEGRVELIQRARGAWTAAHGVQVRRRDFAAVGEEAFVPPTETKQIALYSFNEFDMGDLHIEGAARIERTDQEDTNGGEDERFTTISLSGGADYHVSDAVRIGGTVFRTERAPSTEELFSNGPHLATEQFEIGNPDLDKETATGVEVAVRHREGGHGITVNAFYTDYNDYIFERATGEEEDGLDVFRFTGADAEFYGLEAQVEQRVYTGDTWSFGVDGLAEYVRATTSDGNLPRIPPLSLLGGVEAATDRIFLRAEVEWADDQDKVATFEEPTEGFTLLNLSAAYSFDDRITFRFGVDNVTNEEARQHSSFLKESAPLPGRNFKFSVGAKL